jgi:hypothetical protein
MEHHHSLVFALAETLTPFYRPSISGSAAFLFRGVNLMNWEAVSAACAVLALAGSAVNVWQHQQTRATLLKMRLSIARLRIQTLKESQKEFAGVRQSISALEAGAAATNARISTLHPRAASLV